VGANAQWEEDGKEGKCTGDTKNGKLRTKTSWEEVYCNMKGEVRRKWGHKYKIRGTQETSNTG